MQLSGESVKLPKAWTQPVSTPKASPDTQFSGPMRVLQELGANEGSDLEINDPIARQIVTTGEVSMAFRMCVTMVQHG